MRCLIVIPHIFDPQQRSVYSSQKESKRLSKVKALRSATIENLCRHGEDHWIHASLGKNKPVITRKLKKNNGVDLTIRVYTNLSATLTNTLPKDHRLQILNVEGMDLLDIPKYASQELIKNHKEYEILGYMEDDILIEDPEFFSKIKYMQESLPEDYVIIPHRCEQIPERGDVILSGDPDGGRPDLFWDTGEMIAINWPTGKKEFYRATNPHSGCFFISRKQAEKVLKHWEKRNWISPFELSGPLEQAASGRLIETLKVMKPIPRDYQFFMVRHLDELWKRHNFEEHTCSGSKNKSKVGK